jgi:hypothetical protein
VTTDDGTISSYAGTVATPLKITSTVSTSNSFGAIYSATNGTVATHRGGTTFTTFSSGYATSAYIVVDGSEREAYYTLPQNRARMIFGDPVWFYRMNEAAGTTIDNYEGTAAYDGTTAGTPTLNQAGPATDTTSILFDSINDSVAVTYAAALFPSEFTLESWIKTSPADGGVFLDYTGGSATKGIYLQITAQKLDVAIGDGSSIETIYLGGPSGAASFSDSTWYHISITYRQGVVAIYVNGELLARARFTFSPPTSGTMYLGRNNSGSSFYGGNISSVGMHSVAYGASVIEDFYNAGSASSICRQGSGQWIESVPSWPYVSGADTITTVGVLSGTTATTYRAARL